MKNSESPQRVLCDIDGVLGDLSPGIVAAINQQYGTTHEPQHWISWDWPIEQLQLLTTMGVKEALDWLFSNEHYARSTPIVKAQEVLQTWHDQGTQILVATSRVPESREVTLDWLKQHYPFIEESDIHIRPNTTTSGSAHKIAIAEQLQPQLYFEDEPAMVKKLLTVWTPAQLAILRVINQPWNQDEQLNPYRTSWDQQQELYT